MFRDASRSFVVWKLALRAGTSEHLSKLQMPRPPYEKCQTAWRNQNLYIHTAAYAWALIIAHSINKPQSRICEAHSDDDYYTVRLEQ